eukprot:6191180-Pleurochrysis_carterae.AAC.1
MASSGYFLSTPHRVGRKERISLPFFFNPSLDATVTPLPLPLGALIALERLIRATLQRDAAAASTQSKR